MGESYTNNYQAVFDAVSRQFDISHLTNQASNAIQTLELEHVRPSVLYKPRISIDGNKWCALYGENLQDGVAGFGDSPELAMRDFDDEWQKKLKHPAV